jgi:hypothetical protein
MTLMNLQKYYMARPSYSKSTSSSIGRGGRRIGTREPRKTIWLVVEGEKTEKLYFGGIRKMADLTATEIKVEHCKKGTSPIQIVESGQKLLSQDFPQIDEVWCIFDREAKKYERNFKLALEMAAQPVAAGKRLRCAVSNPCFEFWILLHFVRTDKPFCNCQEVLADLKKEAPSYTKSNRSEIEKICNEVSKAVEHARWLRNRNVTCPSTDVDLLIGTLLKEFSGNGAI